jgi:hypothetical protein
VESARVVSRVDLFQDGDHVRVAIPDADDLEDVAVDVTDVDPILSDVYLPERSKLRACWLEEFNHDPSHGPGGRDVRSM